MPTLLPTAAAVISPINAFCLLPRSYEAHLAFYTDVLGLRVKRVEESFVAFEVRGVVPCLWEVGHICHHLGYRVPTIIDPAAVAILDLAVTSQQALDTAEQASRAGGHVVLPLDSGEAGFLVRDPNSTWWRVTVSTDEAGVVPSIGGVTLLVQDIAASARFYDRMGFARQTAARPRHLYDTGNNIRLELLPRASFTAEHALHRPAPNGPIAMPAIGCRSVSDVERVVKALADGGLPIDVAQRMHAWGFQAAYLTDPDFNIWEVYTTERPDI